MSNVTVQEALKAAIDCLERNEEWDGQFQHDIQLCKSALSEIEKCEPVVQAIRERDRLGFAVVNVIGKLDEIIENTQEVEIDDFLHIAIPIDMWNELQAALEDMPKRADIYTSPQPREWVGLPVIEMNKIINKSSSDMEIAMSIEAALFQLNMKG